MKAKNLNQIFKAIEDEYFRKGRSLSPTTIEKVMDFLKKELSLDPDNIEEEDED